MTIAIMTIPFCVEIFAENERTIGGSNINKVSIWKVNQRILILRITENIKENIQCRMQEVYS